jgi:hypothetical protein
MPVERTPLLSTFDDAVAYEKGRLLALQNFMRDPEARKRCEDAYGVDRCKQTFPEAYTPSPFFSRLIDKMKFVTL